jgi:hypothetical protein
MISVSNIVRIEGIPFQEYLQLPGYSHSFLKREVNGVAPDLETTDNMRLGSLVDAILTEPEKADMSSHLYEAARAIAYEVKTKFAAALKLFLKQLSFTADMEMSGFIMPVKGRLDFLLPGHAVIDLKVTKMKDIPALIEHMGYKNQLWHYCQMAQVKVAYLMIYCVPTKKVYLIKLDCSSNTNFFWEEKILKFGKVAA